MAITGTKMEEETAMAYNRFALQFIGRSKTFAATPAPTAPQA
jgi:hypothetical protein